MKDFMESVKIKIFLGYFTLVVLASLIVWVIYSEIPRYSTEKIDLGPANNKFLYINNILTNLYQAEGLERNYTRTGQRRHYQHYLRLMDTISLQIDTLALIINNPSQQIRSDSIKKLLQLKQRNLQEISVIKKRYSSTASYQQVMDKLTSGQDSIDDYLKVYKSITTTHDSVYVKQKKKTFFERLANVFAPQEKGDSNLQVWTTHAIQVDSLIGTVNPADSITGFITAIISDIRDESIAVETRLKQKEQEILDNDRIITLQLRQMLSDIESEELISSFLEVETQQSRIKKATWLIILAGSFAFITIIFFLVTILKDLTRSHYYRKSLEEAKAYSESLLKSKEQFMLSLTHDLKTPLSSIIGFAGFMEDDSDVSPRHRKYLQNINRAAKHILKLINDLLDLARYETGKLTIDHIPFNLKLLVDDIVEEFRPQALAKNIELQLQSNIPPSTIYINDPIRITQIFNNLISNAVKFTEKGKVVTKVSVAGLSEKTDQISIEVTDTGIGISEEDIRRIFEEFTRASVADRQYEGSGLGLTVIQKIIDLMQGTIEVKSKPGEGSSFIVSLPLEKSEKLTGSTLEIPAESREATAIIIEEKIWLIDDDQTFLEMTEAILKSAGMEVHSFIDPEKAISAFHEGCASLLITDIQMPGINGIEVLKQIQEKNGGPIKAIAVSGSNFRESEYTGFSAFIQKPFKAQTLIDVISGQRKVIIATDNLNRTAGMSKNGYNLSQFAAFTGNDPENLRQILISFIDSGKQDVRLFRQYLRRKNDKALSELVHKMLPLYRQLEAFDIAELLSQLEMGASPGHDKNSYYSLGKAALEKMEALLDTIRKEENINIG